MTDTLFSTNVVTDDQNSSVIEHTSENMPARGFFFAVVDEVGKDGFLVRKVYGSLSDPYLKAMNLPDQSMWREVFPEKYGLSGKGLNSKASVAEHVMGVNTKSRYVSTSRLSLKVRLGSKENLYTLI